MCFSNFSWFRVFGGGNFGGMITNASDATLLTLRYKLDHRSWALRLCVRFEGHFEPIFVVRRDIRDTDFV